jgi:hypothetical protein
MTDEMKIPGKRGWLFILTLTAVVGTVATVRSGHTGGTLVLAYWAIILAFPFGIVGAMVVGLLASLSVLPERHRLSICALAAYLVLAAYVGLFVYMFVPAHYILGWDHSRGMADSLWQMHGEEILHADPKVSHDPARYVTAMHVIWQDRLTYLALWSPITAIVGLLVGLAAHRHSSVVGEASDIARGQRQ